MRLAFLLVCLVLLQPLSFVAEARLCRLHWATRQPERVAQLVLTEERWAYWYTLRKLWLGLWRVSLAAPSCHACKPPALVLNLAAAGELDQAAHALCNAAAAWPWRPLAAGLPARPAAGPAEQLAAACPVWVLGRGGSGVCFQLSPQNPILCKLGGT